MMLNNELNYYVVPSTNDTLTIEYTLRGVQDTVYSYIYTREYPVLCVHSYIYNCGV